MSILTPTRQKFIDRILPFVLVSSLNNDLLPSVTLAQAIVESGWGTSSIAVKGFNFFGIKANKEWNGPSMDKLTQEVYSGVMVNIHQLFRVYGSVKEGVFDHGKFLRRPHYSKLWGEKDYEKYCFELKDAGYATDDEYFETITKTVKKYDLTRYDKGMKIYKVFLSPSSQDWNKYIVGNTNEEAVCNMIADQVEAILERHNLLVVQNDPSDTPTQHAAAANAFNPDIIVPIHTNAGGSRGCEVFCYNKDNKTAKGTILANKIYSEVSAITPSVDRGVKTNTKFTEIARTKAPVAYVEVAFHDSKEDAIWILANIKQIATAISKGILNYFEIVYKPEQIVYNEYKAKVTASYLRVRKTPDTSVTHNIVKSLKQGTVVVISEVKDGWGYVALEGGWIFLKYVSNM